MSSDYTIQVGLVPLQLLRGDITTIKVDVILNAANEQLAGGGGVDGAIHSAGGPQIMRELDAIRARLGKCRTGSAVVTGAGDLPAKFVFHTVGPVYSDGKSGEPEALASCYETCLNLALANGAKTISFPSISTGVYGYPVKEAAAIAIRTIASWLSIHAGVLSAIKLVQFSESDHQTYRACAENLRGSIATETHR